jgi:hypothetical protein
MGPKDQTYKVGVQEVYTSWVTVEAKTVEDAKRMAKDIIPSGSQEPEPQYSHTLDKETWTVEDEDGNYH